MMSWLAAALAALLLTALQYRLPRRLAALAAILRAAALTLLVALLFDAPAGRAPDVAPIVALDVSASWTRASDTSAFADARNEALRLASDSVLFLGDSARFLAEPPPEPADTRSQLGELVTRAVGEGRPVVLFTDGEVEDPGRLAELPAGSRVVLATRAERPDIAIRSLEAPGAAVAGDTIEVTAALIAGAAGAGATSLSVALGDQRAARVLVDSLPPGGERLLRVRLVARGSGSQRLTAAVDPGDGEPRNDTLVRRIEIRSTPAVVWVSSAPDQDSRFALASLRGTLRLPTRAYLRIAPGTWRLDGPLTPVSEVEVRRALRSAPIAVLHGDTAIFGLPRIATGGRLALIPAAAVLGAAADDDWYPVEVPPSPLSAPLSGLPLDSLPPVSVGARAPRGEWSALVVARARRYDRRPAIVGTTSPRRIVVDARGLWRWHFRGGPGDAAFVAVWGAIFDWLAEERRDLGALALVNAEPRAGEPLRWRVGAADSAVLRIRAAGGAIVDSARPIDAAGGEVMTASLPAGDYIADAAGQSLAFTVNQSRELLPAAPASLPELRAGAAPAREPLRHRLWPYAAIVILLCAEWIMRRRAGLR